MKPKKAPAIIVAAVVVLFFGVFLVVSISEQRHAAAVTAERAQQEARQRQNEWQEHLKRVAYDQAHPEVIAARKAAAEAKVRHDAAVRVAQRKRDAVLAAENAHKEAEAAEAERVAHKDDFVITTDADFWETDSYMCNGMDQAAEALASGQSVETSTMPGHHDITSGTHVKVVGHKTGFCPGTTTKVSYTEVEVHDGNSSLNGSDGYIVEGILAKE
jgi:hypothetical protein